LAYVTEDNDFLLADADGSDPQPILDQGAFSAVDAPLFSPDGVHICFSAVLPSAAARASLVDRLLGVGVAQAHSVPSDWYCQPVDGSSEPQRLTELNAIGLYGDFDETGDQMAFLTTAGVYLMNADGSDLTQLREIAATGTINWLP
jgi:Tol biopolymer transport system component